MDAFSKAGIGFLQDPYGQTDLRAEGNLEHLARAGANSALRRLIKQVGDLKLGGNGGTPNAFFYNFQNLPNSITVGFDQTAGTQFGTAKIARYHDRSIAHHAHTIKTIRDGVLSGGDESE